MIADEARRVLASSGEDGEPVALPVSVLPRLDLDDVPEGVSYEVGTVKDGALHLDWSGRMIREGARLVGEAVHTWTPKYWCSPLGLEQYLDLVSRAVETRHRVRDDVALTDYDDDSAYVMLRFRMETGERNLGRAYETVRKIVAEVEVVAQHSGPGRRAPRPSRPLEARRTPCRDGLRRPAVPTGGAASRGFG